VFPTGPTQYIFHMPMARYSLYVLKVPLNSKQTNTTISDLLVILYVKKQNRACISIMDHIGL